jgi:hypothetical protein
LFYQEHTVDRAFYWTPVGPNLLLASSFSLDLVVGHSLQDILLEVITVSGWDVVWHFLRVDFCIAAAWSMAEARVGPRTGGAESLQVSPDFR